MTKLRAVFIGDVRFDQCPVFEYNPATGEFEMLIDKEFRYAPVAIEEDDDWLLFVIDSSHEDPSEHVATSVGKENLYQLLKSFK